MQNYQWIIVGVIILAILFVGAVNKQSIEDCMALGNSKDTCYKAIGG